MYQEYFNYNNCTTGISYYNTYYCSTSHNNTHANVCTTSHDNSWSTSHSNYANICTTSHNNAVNDCPTSQAYTNHINYSNPDSGTAQSLTWSAEWTGNNMNAVFIEESIDAIKDIRAKIQHLGETKGQQTVSITSDPVDTEFDDNQSATPEYVDNDHYNALVNNINNLIAALGGTTPLPTKADGEIVLKSDWENIKIKADTLAAYVVPGYANTVSTQAAAYTNHQNNIIV
jgi:hypothetical protein